MSDGTGMPLMDPEVATRWMLAAPLIVVEQVIRVMLDELLRPVDYSPFEEVSA